ncbi:hypothetical protein WME73_06355 [Sorangium sp. So ce302]|uniref:hypothetical protein n=1 Tax=Sorangium sp. So ce302 TaxID=3133297 RepID=UPI003F5ECBD4
MNRSLRMCALLALTSTLTIVGCGDDESAAPSSAASTSGAGGSGGQGGAGGSAGSGGEGGQGGSTSSASAGGDATGGGGEGGQGGSTSSASAGGDATGGGGAGGQGGSTSSASAGGDATGGGGAGGQGGSTSSASTSSASTSSASAGGGGGGDGAGGGSVSSASASSASTGGGDAAGGGGEGGASACGDLRCDTGETCDSCADDCGVCPPVCGDGVCEPDRENCQACATDCGVCPPAECSHDLCEEGAPLLMACDPCVTELCAEDPACCMSNWDTHCVAGLTAACGRACGCAHDLCEEGAPLDATCNSCVETVCGEDGDSFCCTIGWDEGCIALSERLCDVTCL